MLRMWHIIIMSGTMEPVIRSKIRITADALAEEVDYSDVDLVVLPGGIPGTPNLAANKTVTDTCTAEVNHPSAHRSRWLTLAREWLDDTFDFHLGTGETGG